MTDLPIVQNLTNAPSNPIENQCYYNITQDKYYVYLSSQGVEAILDESDYDSYVLRYTTTSNPNTGNVEENQVTKNGILNHLYTRLNQSSTTGKNLDIYNGTLTQPIQKCRITPSTGNTEADFARIEKGQLINNVYVGEPIAIIYPKIIFNNNKLIEHIKFNNIIGDEEITCFNDTLVHMLYPDIKIQIIETSSPADASIGYIEGETISLKFQYTSYTTLPILHNVHIGSDNIYNSLLDATMNISGNSSLSPTSGSGNRTYVVTADDVEYSQKHKNFYINLHYDSEYSSLKDIDILNMLSIKIGQKHTYGDLTYTDTNNNTVTTRYSDYKTLNNFIADNTTIEFTSINIIEGVYYD